MLSDRIVAKLDNLPNSPGVYIFKDARDNVLYVGKATSLRSRVRSYFQSSNSDERYFVSTLADEIGDLETIVTHSEKEAVLLENHLIKERRPRYNIKLRDDKEYLSLRLDFKAQWPRLEVVRRPRSDHASYFGPYPSAQSARHTLRLINRHFQLRTCTDTELASRKRPCLQYQIKRCPGPCVLPVDRDQYMNHVQDVARFLSGKHDELVDDLSARMKQAAIDLDYETAAVLRDQVRAIESVREAQNVSAVRSIDQDAIGMYREAEQAEIAVLQIRGGRLVGVTTYALDHVRLPDAELVASFVREYYALHTALPNEVILPIEIDAMIGVRQMLQDALGEGRDTELIAPQRGPRVRLIEMANENAAHAYREKARAKADADERLTRLMSKLRLAKLPRRIECIDVSHTGGTDTVAAVVALENGEPDRKRYRSFHIKSVSGGDDYGAMYEALSRRFRRGRDGDESWSFPDLLVVDGGKGQLNVALTAAQDLGITDLAIVGLAKEKENVMGDKLVDRVFLPGQKNAITLRESSAELHLLATVRDEAHRVSNALREKLGKRRKLKSGLEDVPGVGKKTRAVLLRELGSLRAVRAASLQELVDAGASKPQARAIHAYFHAEAEQAAEPPDAMDESQEAAIDSAFSEEAESEEIQEVDRQED